MRVAVRHGSRDGHEPHAAPDRPARRDRHAARLRRGRWLWDRGASQGWWAERASAPIKRLLVEHLGLRAGERVLDIGCGPGAFFGTLLEEIGPEGRVVGIDYSPKMVRGARSRVERHGWDNVEVRQADFSRAELEDEGFHAAVALTSLSAMPDVPAAVENAYRALRPGGRLFVFDFRLVPRGIGAPVIWGLGLLYRALAGWTGQDVLDAVRATFDRVDMAVVKQKKVRDESVVTLFVATKSE
jgi:ubiquinone/menaquinone biosynthesis C-methylase UbiE